MKKIFLSVFVLAAAVCQGQQSAQTAWLASFNTISFSKKYSLHVELQLRSTDDADQLQTILPRIGINKHLNKRQIITAGYAYIPNRITLMGESEMLAEHRLWQQYIYMQPLSKIISLQHRLRLEERWLPVATVSNNEISKTSSAYTTRLRYFARTIIPLSKHEQTFQKGLFVSLQNELFFNITDQSNVNGSWFDQNRAYVAMGYRLSKKADIELGYLNQYIKRKEGQEALINNVAQVAFYTRL